MRTILKVLTATFLLSWAGVYLDPALRASSYITQEDAKDCAGEKIGMTRFSQDPSSLWWQCCLEDGNSCRPGFKMYPELRHLAKKCTPRITPRSWRKCK